MRSSVVATSWTFLEQSQSFPCEILVQRPIQRAHNSWQHSRSLHVWISTSSKTVVPKTVAMTLRGWHFDFMGGEGVSMTLMLSSSQVSAHDAPYVCPL
ncbi:hypothetical protein AVEN_86013-1 [Araneus ventricosus]|uniref:Uncharacterized protein n=1 Tax=Araneus ventricosus TaxID=182803 RepID=A0A4Y2VXG8_ARAVE|nr:hypothetical protein AVEN_86013-1 [Araneus ventricosus]